MDSTIANVHHWHANRTAARWSTPKSATLPARTSDAISKVRKLRLHERNKRKYYTFASEEAEKVDHKGSHAATDDRPTFPRATQERKHDADGSSATES